MVLLMLHSSTHFHFHLHIHICTLDLKSAGILILIGPQLYPLRMVIFCDLYNKLLELDPQSNSPQARR